MTQLLDPRAAWNGATLGLARLHGEPLKAYAQP